MAALTIVDLPHPVTLEGMTAREADRGCISDFAKGDVHAVLNGRLAPRSEWDDPMRPGSVLVLRTRVAGDDTDPLRTVLQVALLVAAFYVGGLPGLTAGTKAVLTAAIVVGGNLVINAIAPPRLPDFGADGGGAPEPVYSLIGGANRARPYEPFLLVLGTHRVFPDLGAREYTTFESAPAAGAATSSYTDSADSGALWGPPDIPAPPASAAGGSTEQYLHQIFHYGLGDHARSDDRIADTLLTDFRDVEKQVAGADGALTLFAGNVDTEAGAALEDVGWVTRQTAANTNRIELDFQASLFRVGDSGSPETHSVTLLVEMWPDSDAADVRKTTVTLSNAKYEALRLTAPYADLDPEGVWHVRVRRAAAPSADDRVSDDVAFTALRAFQPDDADYAGQNRMALRIRASGQLHGRVDRLSSTVSQLIPKWDGSTWVARQVTSNPAWLFRWYAIGIRINGRLRAGVGLAAVDDAVLKRWGAWCDTHGLECNFVIDRDMSHAEVLALIAKCGRASPSWATGRLGVVYDQENTAPSFYFDPGNIIDGSMETDWVSGAIAEEIAMRYIEPDLDWQYNTVRRRVPGAAAANRTATLTLPGVTSREQAAKECNLQAARQLYHRRRIRWRTGPEGLSLARSQTGNLSHSLVSGGLTGRVLAGTRDVLTLSRPVPLPASRAADRADDYILLRLPNGALHTSIVGRAPGSADPDETDRVTLSTPLAGDIDADGGAPIDVLWRYYPGDRPPLRVKLVGVDPQASGEVALEAIDETPLYYAAATSDLTVDLPRLRRAWPRVLGIEVTELLIRAGGGYAVEITAALSVDGDWRGGEVLFSLDGGPERLAGRLVDGDLEVSWIAPLSGELRITAVPGSAAAPAGRRLTVTHAIVGVLAAPAGPVGFQAAPVAGGYVARWTRPAEADHAYTEILDGDPDGEIAAATPRGDATGTAFLRLDATAGEELRVWARHVDQLGNRGDAAHADVTPLAAGDAAAAAHFLQPVVEVPIQATGGKDITDATAFDPDPAGATLTLAEGSATKEVTVAGGVSGAGVAAALSGDDADEFEIVDI